MSRHRAFRRAGTALVALVLMALPACALPTANPIDNTSWKMESIGPPDNLTQVIEGTNVSLQFVRNGHIVTGSTGCNAFQGTYEVEGSSLTIEYEIGPGQRCDLSAIVEQEQMFLSTFVEAESYVIDGDMLTIDCGDRVLVFIRR
ncbi:META domain-containing protein [Chloroflexota bacterium]